MQRLLSTRGIDAEIQPTNGPGDATCLARQAISQSRELIICYGGDGTINEVVQAMALGPASLAVWAGGTSNVVARDLGLPFSADKLADVIAAGKTIRVSLGVASCEGWGSDD